MKKIIWIFIFLFFMLTGVVIAEQRLSASYILDNDDIDSGGIGTSAAATRLAFQQVDTFSGVASNAITQLINGLHFSAQVLQLSGYHSPYDHGTIPLSSTSNATIISYTQFWAKVNNGAPVLIGTNNTDSNSYTNGWYINWNSVVPVPVTASISLLVRAYDGLSFGPMYEIATPFIVDNEIPSITSLTAQYAYFSPNNSAGIKDTDQVSFGIAESYGDYWDLKIKSGATVVKEYTSTFNATGSFSQVWNGKNTSNSFVSDGAYTYELTVTDLAGNSLSSSGNFTVDNTNPVFSAVQLTSSGLAVNSGQGQLAANWTCADALSPSLYYDLYYAPNPYSFSSKSLDTSTDTTWSISNIPDWTDYKIQLVAVDDAGNSVVTQSLVARTPDRTAPSIISLTEVRGTEDINFSVNWAANKTDNASTGNALTWAITEYTSGEDAIKSRTRDLFSAMSINQNSVTFNLFPNANTNGALAYNRYGYQGAAFKLKLTDASGNYTEMDIPANITAVNDPPIIKNLITDSKSGTNQGSTYDSNYYNFIFDENTSDFIELDSFVDDVDTPTSSLSFVASTNANVNLSIGNAATNHRLDITPVLATWYGQVTITLNVTDMESVPTNSYAYQPLVVRVWPVNSTPNIDSNIAVWYSTTSNYVLLNLHGNKSDALMEDSLNQMLWSIQSNEQPGLFASITGENNPLDVINLVPSASTYGIANLVLQLQDTDTAPQSVFPTYVPNPKTATINIAFPVIGTVNAQLAVEDSASWNMGLIKLSSVKDTGSNLTWSISDARSFITTANTATKDIRLASVANAWGTSNMTLRLCFDDGGTLKTAEKIALLTLTAVNDIPQLSTINMQFASDLLSNKVMNTDRITANAVGYTDVGYSNDTKDTGVLGDEYTLDSIPSLNYVKNTKQYNYVLKVNGSPVQFAVNCTTNAFAYTIPDNSDGTTISFEIVPQDSIASGSIETVSYQVNNRPGLSTINTPSGVYFVTHNIVISWNATTDIDSDPIKYKVNIWKVADGAPTPSITSETPYWNSGWRSGYTALSDTSLNGGTYYYAVYSGNEFNATAYDYRLPIEIRKFYIQAAPLEADWVIETPELHPNTEMESPGQYQVIYGNKPAYTGIWIECNNAYYSGSVLVTTNQMIEAVELNTATDWVYMLEIPESGTTTCDVYIKDIAGNMSLSYEFVLTEDHTPPGPPDITPSGFNWNGVSYTEISNAASVVVLGTKEAGCAVYFNDGIRKTQVVPYSQETDFNFTVRSERPAGLITLKDRAGNESTPVTINISFLLGTPGITVTKSREVLNTLPTTAGLSTQVKNELAQSTIQWSCNRIVTSYSIINETTNTSLTSGTDVASGSVVEYVIAGSGLASGENTIMIVVTDNATNTGNLSFVLIRDEAPPTINCNNIFNKNGNAYIMGKLENTETVFVNGSTSNIFISGENWIYQSSAFPFSITDITITARDAVYNESTYLIWEHSNWADLLASGILAQVVQADQLPDNILALKSVPISQKSTQSYGLSTKARSQLFEKQTAQKEIGMTPELANTAYQIYAKTFNQNIVYDLDLKGYKVKLMLPYEDNIKIEEKKLMIVKFNQETGVWENPELPSVINTKTKIVTATLPSTGIWAIAEYRPAATDLTSARIYPNPWKPNSGNLNTGDATGITFDQLPSNSKVRIYTISGELVREESVLGSSWVWDGSNMAGKRVASDTYLYIIASGKEIKKGKITVIR